MSDMAETLAVIPDFHQLAGIPERLPETDGVPLETPWHHAAISLLIEVLTCLWHDREDFFAGGNMFLYYSKRRRQNEDFRGPDFFVVEGVERRRPRESWIVWEEHDKYPDVILELLSRTTAEADLTTKKDLYEKTFRTPEYFCLNPENQRLQGWRLVNGVYQDIIPDPRGWLWSERLKAWLGTWEGEYLGQKGTWVRLYDESGRLVPLNAEADKSKAEAAEMKAEAAEMKAEAAEMEVARLKALLAEKGIVPKS